MAARDQVSVSDAKAKLDDVIGKTRAEWYKPVQVAELLRKLRLEPDSKVNLHDVESYRNASKTWRDEVSLELVGKRSTSSQRFQDDIWSALRPEVLATLAEENQNSGIVEAYIYLMFSKAQGAINEIFLYINSSTPETFSLETVFDYFRGSSAARKTQDRMLECVMYCLFQQSLWVSGGGVEIKISPPDNPPPTKIQKLAHELLGLEDNVGVRREPATVVRGSSTNSADGGIDAFGNFGIVVQVKNVRLRHRDVEKIVRSLDANRIVIVCESYLGAEDEPPLPDNLVRIYTRDELSSLYQSAMASPHTIGLRLLECLRSSLRQEFPVASTIADFLMGRQYTAEKLSESWLVD
jgi:hypothetical protein